MSSAASDSMRFDYVALGLTLLDVLARPVAAFPDGDAVGFVEEIRMTPTGTAAGPAAVAARLGLRTRLVGAVGDDEIGRVLLRALEERGVDTACIERIAGQRTSATVLGIRPNGERPALHAIGASLSLAIPESAWDNVLAAPVLHLGGIGALPRLDGAPTAALRPSSSTAARAAASSRMARAAALASRASAASPRRPSACALSTRPGVVTRSAPGSAPPAHAGSTRRRARASLARRRRWSRPASAPTPRPAPSSR